MILFRFTCHDMICIQDRKDVFFAANPSCSVQGGTASEGHIHPQTREHPGAGGSSKIQRKSKKNETSEASPTESNWKSYEHHFFLLVSASFMSFFSQHFDEKSWATYQRPDPNVTTASKKPRRKTKTTDDAAKAFSMRWMKVRMVCWVKKNCSLDELPQRKMIEKTNSLGPRNCQQFKVVHLSV